MTHLSSRSPKLKQDPQWPALPPRSRKSLLSNGLARHARHRTVPLTSCPNGSQKSHVLCPSAAEDRTETTTPVAPRASAHPRRWRRSRRAERTRNQPARARFDMLAVLPRPRLLRLSRRPFGERIQPCSLRSVQTPVTSSGPSVRSQAVAHAQRPSQPLTNRMRRMPGRCADAGVAHPQFIFLICVCGMLNEPRHAGATGVRVSDLVTPA